MKTSVTIDDPTSAVPWGWRDIGAAFILSFGGIFVLGQVFPFIVQRLELNVEAGLASPALYVLGLLLTLLILVSVYAFAARRSGWAALGLRPAPWWTVAVTPVLLIVGLLVIVLVNILIVIVRGEMFENPQIEVITGGQALDTTTFVMLLVLVAGLVPMAEELLFRGMLYPVLRKQWGPVLAVIASAAIFAAVHFVLILFPALFILGLMLALLREWSKSIIPSILMHAMQNTIALVGINAMLAGM